MVCGTQVADAGYTGGVGLIRRDIVDVGFAICLEYDGNRQIVAIDKTDIVVGEVVGTAQRKFCERCWHFTGSFALEKRAAVACGTLPTFA